MTSTLPHRLIAERYRLTDDAPQDRSTVVVPATDTLLDRQVQVLLLPPEDSLARRLEQRRAAGRAGPTGSCLATVLDAGDLEGRTYLVLPDDAGQLLSERLRATGRLASEVAAGVALAVLTARQALRDAGRPGGDVVRTDSVLVGGGDPARLLPIPRDGVPSSDDAAPVRAFFGSISTDPSALRSVPEGDEHGLRGALARLAGADDATDVLPDAGGSDRWATVDLPVAVTGPVTAAATGSTSTGGTRGRRKVGPVLAGLASLAVAGGLVVAASTGDPSSEGSPPPPSSSGAPADPATSGEPGRGLRGAGAQPAEDGALPTDAGELLASLEADPALAGPLADRLIDRLSAVTEAPVGEARRQLALEVTELGRAAGVDPRVPAAVQEAMAPLTALDTPADMIADLQPDPSLGGPKAESLLECMWWFLDRNPEQQRAEARTILDELPTWAADGGIRPDLVEAATRIVTPVARGDKVFTAEEAGARLPAAEQAWE